MLDEKCSICRSVMDGSTQDYKLVCSHRFHTECIIDSLRHNPECPVCRDTGGVEVSHWSEWESYGLEEHNDSLDHLKHCISCGKKNPASEYYSTYQLIDEIGKDLLKNKYDDIKTTNKEYKKAFSDIEKELKNGQSECSKRYNNDRIAMFHRVGRSERFSDFMKISRRAKVLNGNFKREISVILHTMGYEKDDDLLEKLLENYVESIKLKRQTSWYMKKIIKNCSKYSLDKYASAAVVNSTDNIIEI